MKDKYNNFTINKKTDSRYDLFEEKESITLGGTKYHEYGTKYHEYLGSIKRMGLSWVFLPEQSEECGFNWYQNSLEDVVFILKELNK